ncbi:ABC transporter ATP-binding protein [Saccharibacillus kuerlensis]|uniref:Multidrug ABC transporter ATP-binding protein n=1 Tax=Saccharibacillus kuerlensis TaxID=459527 RepID=A0ABQ2KUF4_9BACL|nr:ABC transporter ATP-binding protein [Saccharibacillus kuerlensis]GGN93707.1 multidrug ABC transporter ATP-binding protein [Saccharibacillus kuerlensis]
MLKLFRMLKPYRVGVVFVLLMVFVQALSELFLPTLMADIVDNGIAKNNIPHIWQIGGIMLGVALIGVICSIVASYLSAKVSMGFSRDLRSRVFSHAQRFTLKEFDQFGTASLITRTTNDITQIQQVLTMMLRMMAMAPMMMIGGIIMAVSKDAQLSLVLVVVIPVLALLILLIGRSALPLFKAMQKKIDRLNLVLRENLTGIRVIRAFGRENSERERFDQASGDLRDTAIRVNKIMAFMMPAMMLILNFSTIAIIWFGSIRIEAGEMQLGNLMAFVQYAMQILFSLIMVSIIFVMVPRASVSAGRVNEVLDAVPDITDPLSPSLTVQKGRLEFRDVTFSYEGAEAPALSNISFEAGPGEVTAIIGGTGSGKSTLVSLIPRFYEASEGAVLVDGIDIREMAQEELRSKLGYVPQKALLFTGTVAENIRYGYAEATDEEIREAARTAQAEEFINGLEEGYDSPISQGGSNLSGGQKQRLSIARALVRRPEIYIFDDSFSALDFKTDARLRAALKRETQDATVLMVAQRVSTVMDADRIIVMEEGRIAGVGTHAELMETSDVYREIVSSQLSAEEVAG